MKHFSVAFDYSIDSPKHLGLCFLINEEAVAVSWMVEQRHHHFKNSNLLVHCVRYCQLRMAVIHLGHDDKKIGSGEHISLHASYCDNILSVFRAAPKSWSEYTTDEVYTTEKSIQTSLLSIQISKYETNDPCI